MGLFTRKNSTEKTEYMLKQGEATENKDINLDVDAEEQYTRTVSQRIAYAENCCDRMVICQKRLEAAKAEYREVNHYLTDISTIENLEGEKKENLLFEARRIRSLTEDKKSYKNLAAKMSDKKYDFINKHENDMPDILKNLKDCEDNLQAIKTDMHNVEGEKSALKYERKISIQRMNAMRKLLKIVMLLSAVLLAAFTYGQFKGEYDYTIGYYIVVVTAIAAIALILAVNKGQEKNLRIAELKLNKIIGILNKCKLRYVNLKSSVEYMYDTYGVANTYELSSLWQTYLTAKKEREAYFMMSDNLYKATENYNAIIESLNLYDASVWSYQTAAILEPEEMNVIKDTLHKRRDAIKKNMDYNSDLIAKSKENIKQIIEKDPDIGKDILDMVDRKENELLNG